MTSPGGKEVGRVSIRVVPDTSKFREQLKRQLSNMDDIKVGIDIDGDGLREKVQAEAKKAAAGVKAEVKLDVDQNSVGQFAHKAQAALSNVNMPNFLGDMSRMDMVMRQVVNNANQIRASLERTAIHFRLMTESAGNIKGHFQGISARVRLLATDIQGLGFNKVDKDVDKTSSSFRKLGNVGKAIGNGFKAVFSGLASGASAFGNVIGSIGKGLAGFGSAMGDAFGNVAGALQKVGTSVLSVIQVLAIAGAVSALIAIAGAGITAAWGAASAAVAALPNAIGLIAAPLAAVMLGMDGIKKAAKTLQPEFDRLKTAVEGAFVKGLTPAFQTLKAVFPTIQAGLVGTANSLSTLAQGLANIVSKGPGLDNIKTAFTNINGALTGMAPGINSIVSGFLQVIAQKSGFDVLVGTVNTLGAAFQQSVARMTDSSKGASVFDQAMKGLQGTLEAAGRGLISLVENGLKTFAAAAPGVNSLIDSMTGFFNKLDWTKLGTSVGNVFNGIATAINNVPQSTIDGIATAFERLGQVFQDTGFQAQITNLINNLPGLISMIGSLTDAFFRMANVATGVGKILAGVGEIMAGFLTMDVEAMQSGADKIRSGWKDLQVAFTEGVAGVQQTLQSAGAKWGAAANQSMGAINQALLTGAQQAAVSAAVGAEKTAIAMKPPGGGANAAAEWFTISKDIGGKAQLTPFVGPISQSAQAAANATAPPGGDLAAPWKAGVAPIPGAVQTGLQPVPTTVEGIVGQLAPIIQQSFTSLESHAMVGMGKIGTAISGSAVALTTGMTTAFTSVGPVIDTAFTTLGTNVTTGMTGLSTMVTSGMPLIQTAFTTGWDTVSTSMNTSFQLISTGLQTHMTSMSTVVTQGFTAIQAAFTTGWTAVGTSVTTSLTTINQSVIAGVAVWALSVSTGMTNLSTAVTTGFTGVQTAVTTALTTVNQSIIAGVAVWALSVQTGLTAMSTAVSTGFATVQATITAQLTAINSLIIAGVAVWALSVSTQFAAINTAVQTGMTQIQTTIQTTLDQITQVWQTATQQWVTVVTAAMTQLATAISNGAQQALTALRNAVGEMIAVLDGAVSQFYAAGANMGQALADGLNSKVGAVEQAAARLANAAAAATAAAAQIRSPSRVFIGFGEYMSEGLAVGIRNGVHEAERAAGLMISKVSHIAAKIGQTDFVVKTTFVPEGGSSAIESVVRTSLGDWQGSVDSPDYGNVVDKVCEALAQWGVQIDRDGVAKMVNKSNLRRMRR